MNEMYTFSNEGLIAICFGANWNGYKNKICRILLNPIDQGIFLFHKEALLFWGCTEKYLIPLIEVLVMFGYLKKTDDKFVKSSSDRNCLFISDIPDYAYYIPNLSIAFSLIKTKESIYFKPHQDIVNHALEEIVEDNKEIENVLLKDILNNSYKILPADNEKQ